MKKRKINKSMFKMSEEELQEYLHFKKRCFIVPNKKGKGSFRRKQKHSGREEE